MVLKSEYKESRIERVYLEAFPYKIQDIDFGIILDNGYEYSRKWIKSIKWIPRNKNDNILSNFVNNGKLWITNIHDIEKELTQDILVEGIGLALKTHKSEMINYKQELISQCINEILCDEIIQLALYKEIIFK